MGKEQFDGEIIDMDLANCPEDTHFQGPLDIQSIPYDPRAETNCMVIPSVGRSGGLAIAWTNSWISVNIVESNRQFFHLHCQFGQSPPFMLTAVYAIPHSSLRKVLWKNILCLSKGIACLWSVMGDFNDIMNAHKRLGGSNGNNQRM
ncbi:hypothetical protein K1719_012105 [Acacia pycnantha]|nr:hypothetical protein K1719_012105 [Acacia pycnantha]